MPEVGVQLSMVPAAWACVSLQTSSSLPWETLKWLEFLKFDDGRVRKVTQNLAKRVRRPSKVLAKRGARWVRIAWIGQDRPRWPRKTQISLLCLSLCASLSVSVTVCLNMILDEIALHSLYYVKINCVLPIARPRAPVCFLYSN